jgi:signal transduction histidine kinase
MQRVERLVATMLDQVELWSDRITLERAEVDLVALARRAVATVAERAKLSETPIDLVAPAPVWVAADSARVEQAVGQLLDNALMFGAGRPVDVRVEADEREAHVVVCDHGVGLSDEAQARLFDRFARGVSTTHFGGFGLGLWLAQQIATAHGGRIAVESTSGAGATFTLSLPRAR